MLSGCAGAGRLEAPDVGEAVGRPRPSPFVWEGAREALAYFAPIVMQEQAEGAGSLLDRPTRLDPDRSGSLADDHAFALSGGTAGQRPIFYVADEADAERLYLFYGVYYPADWSIAAGRPRVDHAGDFEGALVVVSRESRRVEAVVTQAHKRYYLW